VTVVEIVIELLPGVGSELVDETDGALMIVPALFGRMTIEIDAEPPEVSAPIEHVTVEAPLHVPLFEAAETNVVPDGSTSTSVTPEAEPGPPFETVSE
jgi:hypothetical protein